jgi:hypothetical protein
LFYRLLHHEPVRTSADALRDGNPDPRRDPYDSNQAIPTLLATRDRKRFHRLFPELRIASVQWFSFAAYPLSGGFQAWSLIGEGVARRMLRIERALEPVLGRFMGFRMLLMVEKKGQILSSELDQQGKRKPHGWIVGNPTKGGTLVA